MSRRLTGGVFCFISALLFCTRYIAAAIFGSGLASWSKDLFDAMLSYTGRELLTLSIISLFLGIFYLILAEFEDYKNKNIKRVLREENVK